MGIPSGHFGMVSLAELEDRNLLNLRSLDSLVSAFPKRQ